MASISEQYGKQLNIALEKGTAGSAVSNVKVHNWRKHNQSPSDSTQGRLPSLRLIYTSIVVFFGGNFNFGYQISATNLLAEPLQDFLYSSIKSAYGFELKVLTQYIIWSVVTSIIFFGMIIGAAIASRVTSKIGFKQLFIFVSLVNITSLLMTAASKDYNSAILFTIARFMIGLTIGFGTTVHGVFITEISPSECRGFVGCLAGVSLAVGIVIASVLALPYLFGTPSHWQYVYYIATMPSILLLMHSFFILKESPRFCLMHNDATSAKDSVAYYHGNNDGAETFLAQIRCEMEAVVKDQSLASAWKDRSTRNGIFASMVLNTSVGFSGIIAISMFGTSLLRTVGFSEAGAGVGNCIISTVGVLATITSSFVIDRIGRRILVIGSLVSLAFLNTGVMILTWAFENYKFAWLSYSFIAVLIAFLIAFSLGIGPISWFIATELVDASFSSHVQSIAISTQYFTSFLCPLLFIPLNQTIGPLSFTIFIIPLILSAIYLYKFLPETKR